MPVMAFLGAVFFVVFVVAAAAVVVVNVVVVVCSCCWGARATTMPNNVPAGAVSRPRPPFYNERIKRQTSRLEQCLAPPRSQQRNENNNKNNFKNT